MDLKIGVACSRLIIRAYLDVAKEKFRLSDQKVISFDPCQRNQRDPKIQTRGVLQCDND
jgi:hypothetical protein